MPDENEEKSSLPSFETEEKAPENSLPDESPTTDVPAALERPADAGPVRTSWADQGHTNS